VVAERPQRVVPNPRLNVGAAPSYSLWAVTRVASTSMISGLSASMSWSGLLVVADVDLRQVTSRCSGATFS
jgi:hypothetical protein